jgi:hypothetical protein
MTVDEIIEYFEKTGALGPKGYGLAELQLRTAKLLKAGQAIRNSVDPFQFNRQLLFDSMEAWDKATKEDV